MHLVICYEIFCLSELGLVIATGSRIVLQVFHGQPTTSTTVSVPHPPSIRPRVRARRGQATDPHSIAERVIRVT